MKYFVAVAGLLLATALGAAGGWTMNIADSASNVVIITGKRASEAERTVADTLAARIARRSEVACSVITDGKKLDPEADLVIYLGIPENHDALTSMCAKYGVALPTAKDPGPEGFALKTVVHNGRPAVISAGTDKAGTLYSAGEIERRITFGPASIAMAEADMRSAPAYRIRGSSAHGDKVVSFDYAFAGANTFYSDSDYMDWLHMLGLKTLPGIEVRPNEYLGQYPKEWQSPTEHDNFLCPSVPEARKALIEQWSNEFKPGQERKAHRWSVDHDFLRFSSGDPGGCRCPKCTPWGKQFMLLCDELGQVYVKYHPKAQVQIIMQYLDNAGDEFIFDFLNEKPRPWLSYVSYGPGSNALSSYFRRELRDDLFIYSGDGWINRYLNEILHNLPKQQSICHFSDITHWISSQYQVPHVDPTLAAVFGRRTFNCRPRQMYDVFHHIMLFSEGDIVYSEGFQDEFQQYLWNRMLWDPSRSLEDILLEYARLHFGPAAAPEMVEAILQLERNLQTPLATNDGIDRYYALVKSAGWQIPPNIMRDDYRWRLHMQKAALDKYAQLRLCGQLALQARVERTIKKALAAGDLEAALGAETLLQTPAETAEMKVLREEAERVAAQSAAVDSTAAGAHYILYPETPGAVGPAYMRRVYRLELDFVSLAWMRRQIERARAVRGTDEATKVLQQLANYEDPGPGGYYDDLGNQSRQPHLVKGEIRDVREYMDPENRISQNTIAYSSADGKGVTLRYLALDPKAHYKVRLTMVVPRWPTSYRWGAIPKQSIVANGHYLAKDMDIPQYTAQQFEYDIPQELTKGGELDLWLEKGQGGQTTVASEVWLIKQ